MPASTIQHEQARPIRPPRAMAWTFLLASTSAVLLAGLAATALVFGQVGNLSTPPTRFWPHLLMAGTLTVASLSLRGLRWVFLLRRAETRIPIRDAYVGYMAGLSLLFAPLLLGEIVVRAVILKRRGGVPVITTTIVNLVERAADLLALGFIAATLSLAAGQATAWAYGMLAAFALSWLPLARRTTIAGLTSIVAPLCRVFDGGDEDARAYARLSSSRTWATAMACSLAVWTLPGIGLWIIARAWMAGVGVFDAERIYTSSSAIAALMLAPAGVLIAGPEMIQGLGGAGVSESAAAVMVLGVRLATVGVAVALGAGFLLVHLQSLAGSRGPGLHESLAGSRGPGLRESLAGSRGPGLRESLAGSRGPGLHESLAGSKGPGLREWFAGSGGPGLRDHFDEIADAYDVQIPESRRLALLDRKTRLMKQIIDTHRAHGAGTRGLDVGCGQGAYVERMRSLGFDVAGIDTSQAQVRLAQRKSGRPDLFDAGSVLHIPAADASFDFLYTINVLHHLASMEDQRRAFCELARVVKPGGLIFVHEINTRNILFRFYMGYIFPSLNCIDEGVERWLMPHRLGDYTRTPVADVSYFTFLPDFVPDWIASWLAPVERWLERSAWRIYSAHYMAVLIKPPDA